MKTTCKECRGEKYVSVPVCCGIPDLNETCCGQPIHGHQLCYICKGTGVVEDDREVTDNWIQEENDMAREMNSNDLLDC